MTTLRVIEIFDSLQGEGYWTGAPMTFVRLAGCNAPGLRLDCVRWCDTLESWDPAAGEEIEVAEVVRRVCLPRLCLTGGEPLLQADGVSELVANAHRGGIRVHVETNGTVDPVTEFDWVTVSPKPPEYPLAPGWEGLVDELKLVADEHLDAATAERLAARHPGAIVCIQPRAPGTAEAGAGGRGGVGLGQEAVGPGRASIESAISLVMDHPEWRLSLQTHRILGIR
jgi:7-carboxy-7-deazaguanine synthase